jgi:hypothetical protein
MTDSVTYELKYTSRGHAFHDTSTNVQGEAWWTVRNGLHQGVADPDTIADTIFDQMWELTYFGQMMKDDT